MKGVVPCLAVLTITFFPSVASQPKGEVKPASQAVRRSAPHPVVIKAYIHAYALKEGVDPATALAVAHIESRKGSQEFRVGRISKRFFGPFGIHRCFLSKWRIDLLEPNIEVGVRALRGPNLKNILKRYNTEFNEGYWQAVMKAREKYRREGVG